MFLRFLIFSLLFAILFSCHSYSVQNEKAKDFDSIRLLVADSSIFSNWQAEQYSGKVIPIEDYDVGFVSSNGKVSHTPMQVISFDSQESKKLLLLFDSLIKQPQNNLPNTCIHFYKHVFQCYENGSVAQQISLASSCATFLIEPSKKIVEVDSNSLPAYKNILSIMKRKGAYLYNDDIFFGVK